ncbi:thymosin beta-like isoform X2 [Ornithodoros turicata]|uniref:thymosin beta-like isoform X2 n=1 Tax=Ornithodoros turicata TaxID=34597 RepID=UPI003139316B
MSNPSKESLPKVANEIQQELTNFKQVTLKHTETQEKVVLPSKEDVQQEKIHNTLLHGVEHFEKQNLNHAETQEKVCLPNQQDIESEKEHKQIIEGIETFDAMIEQEKAA